MQRRGKEQARYDLKAQSIYRDDRNLSEVDKDSLISKLHAVCLFLNEADRAATLENSKELEDAYAEVASKGDTEAPSNAEDEVDYHYICFTKSQGTNHIYQLDGDRRQPINLGQLAEGEDLLSKTCLDVIRDMMSREKSSDQFSLMALVEEGM